MSSSGVQAKAERAFPIDGDRHHDQMGKRTHQFEGYLGAHTRTPVFLAPRLLWRKIVAEDQTPAMHRAPGAALRKPGTPMHHPDRGLVTFALFLILPLSAMLTWKHLVKRFGATGELAACSLRKIST